MEAPCTLATQNARNLCCQLTPTPCCRPPTSHPKHICRMGHCCSQRLFPLCCNREKTGSLKTNAGRVCIQSDRLKVAARRTHEELDSVILAPYGTKVAAALWISRLVFGTITMILHSLHSEQHLVTPGETGMRRNQQEQEKG